MTKKIQLWIIIGIFIQSCSEDESFTRRNYPFVESLDIQLVDNTGASVTFNVRQNGTTANTVFGVEYTEIQTGTVDEENRRYRSIEKTGTISDGIQSVRITHDLEAGQQYQVRPFVKSGSFTVFGYPMVFSSLGGLAPEILGISNQIIFGNTDIEVTGNYFSTILERNIVEIPGLENIFEISIIESSVEKLKIRLTQKPLVQLPVENIKYDLKITVAGKNTTLTEAFSIGFPKIEDVSPLKGHVSSRFNLAVTDIMDLFNNQLNFNKIDSFYPEEISPLTKQASFYTGIVPNLPAGSYQLSIQSQEYINEYDQPFEVLNSWSVFLQDFSLPSFEFQKIQVGRNVVFMGTGGWTEISSLGLDLGQLKSFPEFEGIYSRRNHLLTAGQNRYIYFGLGTPLLSSESLKDFSRLDIQNNIWEKLPDFTLENSSISYSFEFQGNIVAIPFNYSNFQVFEVNSKNWRESDHVIPALLRNAISITSRGNEIFFLIREADIKIYKFILGQSPTLIGTLSTDSNTDLNRKAEIIEANNNIYTILGTSLIYKLDNQTNNLIRIQSIFDSINSDIMPLKTSEGLLMAFPVHPAINAEKRIIYKLQIEE